MSLADMLGVDAASAADMAKASIVLCVILNVVFLAFAQDARMSRKRGECALYLGLIMASTAYAAATIRFGGGLSYLVFFVLFAAAGVAVLTRIISVLIVWFARAGKYVVTGKF